MVCQIKLTKGLYAIVDQADFTELNQYKWQASYHGRNGTDKWYARRSLGDGQTISMQRHILGLKTGDRRVGHHKNDNTLDNRRENLEILPSNHHNMLHSPRWSRA